MSDMLLSYLNKQLHSEYKAMYTYMYYAARENHPRIKSALKKFYDEEQQHAVMLMEFIFRMGGTPELPDSIPIEIHDDILPALVLSVAEEESAVQMYKMIRSLMSSDEERSIIDITIAQEQKHHEVLGSILTLAKSELL
ncbi:Ferritin Dps family protein [Desulfurispirillum indicum S5]|uniref:Ferritin Dps family protein n=1 Tax=Desulfurispirillum indicum (strain ATCC BAA-1389 / DSM 22839 / S5) TaxID=653733 RepID=E6W5N0_DESIS|nr:ferritin-like domain-containing protein [Desulfurispirillum indicum]ADU66061.1 Ferritin Dps family protein [Desulfurispirillum indicum S5]